MIFKIHYGLWYGGLVGIIPFMFNYAYTYSGATGTQHGLLYTILPFVALLAKPLVCSFADKHAAHHQCLLFFIFTAMIGFGSLAIYPFFPNFYKEHKNITWILYCLAALVGNTSMCVVNSIGDSLAVNSSQRKNVSYGHYRLWGPVGFGVFGALWGFANEISFLPKYTPGILTMVLILSLNMILIAFWNDMEDFKVISAVASETGVGGGEDTNSTSPSQNYGSTGRNGNNHQVADGADGSRNVSASDDEVITTTETKKVNRLQLLMLLVRKEKSIFVFLFIFTFCGVMTGIHWQFFFRYLQQMAEKDAQNFSIVTTFALPVQALGGELVFFMLSGKILQALGSSFTLVVCLFAFAARYLSYAYLIPYVNIYWILLVELLQGPAFGLMYCVLTYEANHYSERIDDIVAQTSISTDSQLKNSLHATLQGLLGASFEGLGLGLGAIIGGRAYDADPLLMWQIAGFSALVLATLYLIGTIVSTLIRASHSSSLAGLSA